MAEGLRLAEIRRRFASTGADAESERIRRWLAPHAGPAPGRRAELAGIEEDLRALKGREAARLRAMALVCLGRHAEASALLRKDRSPEAAPWRAEAEFMRGRLREARATLRRTREEHLSALVRFLLGEGGPALELLRETLKRRGEDALGWGLAGFLAMRSGDWDEAERAAARAVELRPEEGWPLALRALARRLAVGPSELMALSLADLDRALQRERAAWIHQLRAEYREKSGHMTGALADLDQAIALSPPSAILHAQRAHCLFLVKRYEESAADFTRALDLLPQHVPFLWQRANARWLAGDLKAAYEDARRCARADPKSARLRLGAARFALLLGKQRTVAARLRRWREAQDPTLRSGARFLEAGEHFRAKEYGPSLSGFEEAERIAYSRRCPVIFTELGYPQLARAFQFMSRSHKERPMENPARKPVLVIAGLGLHYPYQATLEVLKALSECDVVFNNLSGVESMEFLTLFCRDVRTVSYDKNDEEIWVEKIFSALGPGQRAAFVTRGHPFVAGHLAQGLLTRAQKDGVEVRSYGAVSYLDNILALAGLATVEAFWGLQVYDTRLAAEGNVQLQPNLLLILEAAGGRGKGLPAWVDRHIGELVRKLRSVYPPNHRFYIYGPRYEARRLEEASIEELEERLRGLDPELFSSIAILVPPVRNLVPLELQREDKAYA